MDLLLRVRAFQYVDGSARIESSAPAISLSPNGNWACRVLRVICIAINKA